MPQPPRCCHKTLYWDSQAQDWNACFECPMRASLCVPATPNALKQALDALETARSAIEPLTGAQIRLHRIPVDTAVRIENAITSVRAALGETGTPASPIHGDYERRITDLTPTLGMARAVARADLELDEARADGVPVPCPLCGYQHGHAIGCANNPVDVALARGVALPDDTKENDHA